VLGYEHLLSVAPEGRFLVRLDERRILEVLAAWRQVERFNHP
jgi:hypothetical protein